MNENSAIDVDVNSTIRRNGPDSVWTLHRAEWAAFREGWDAAVPIDLLWLDGFNRETFDSYWPLINPDGGVCILHSTLNNHRNYAFIQVALQVQLFFVPWKLVIIITIVFDACIGT